MVICIIHIFRDGGGGDADDVDVRLLPDDGNGSCHFSVVDGVRKLLNGARNWGALNGRRVICKWIEQCGSTVIVFYFEFVSVKQSQFVSRDCDGCV